MRTLYAQQLVSTRDMEKAQSEAGRLRSAVTALQAAADQVPQAQTARNRARDVRIGRLQGEIATLAAQRETLRAETTRLSYEIERRRIRAPIDGRVGEAVNLRVGTVVSQGDRLGSIVPAGRLLIVAQYPAPGAMGRIRAGQSATLRLAGFPWAEFGTVSATVAGVAQEVRDGRVRVELALTNHSSFRGTLEHGMPGTLEVAVEHVSPFGLILRTAFSGPKKKIRPELLPPAAAYRTAGVRLMEARSRREDEKLSTETGQLRTSSLTRSGNPQ